MRSVIAILVFAVIPGMVFCSDMRDFVDSDSAPFKSVVIDPDQDVYGIPWGTTETTFTNRVGSPSGYFRLRQGRTAMMYGRDHLFTFTDGKLSGLRISGDLVDTELKKELPPNEVFDDLKWRLVNGILPEMSLPDIKKIVGESLRKGDNQWYSYRTQHARVELQFNRWGNKGTGDDAYWLRNIVIERY